jgi:tetratricopeptide (TPR) repeat protein
MNRTFRLPSFTSSTSPLSFRVTSCGDTSATSSAFSPRSSGATYNALGSAYAHLGRTEDAFAALRAALRLDPDFAAAHANLGMLQLTAGQRPEASNSLEKAARLAPNPAEASFALGVLSLIRHDRPSALKQYSLLKTLSPELADLLYYTIYDGAYVVEVKPK